VCVIFIAISSESQPSFVRSRYLIEMSAEVASATTNAAGLTAPGSVHFGRSREILQEALEVMAQLVQVGKRITGRHASIASMLQDQQSDQDAETDLHRRLSVLLGDAGVQLTGNEADAAAAARAAVEDVSGRWDRRLSEAEAKTNALQLEHHREVANLQRDWLDLVAHSRKLEAALDLQRSAADIVLQNQEAVQGFLRNNNVSVDTMATARATGRSKSAASDDAAMPTPARSPSKRSNADADDAAANAQPDHHDQRVREQPSPQEAPLRPSDRSARAEEAAPEPLGETSRPRPEPHPFKDDATNKHDHRPAQLSLAELIRETKQKVKEQYEADALDAGRHAARGGGGGGGGENPSGDAFPAARGSQQQHRQAGLDGRGRQQSDNLGGENRFLGRRHDITLSEDLDGAKGRESRSVTLGLVLGLRRQSCRLVGVEVLRVLPGSPAHNAGIRPRSVLVELNGIPIRSSKDVQVALQQVKRYVHRRRRQDAQWTTNEVLVPFQVIDLPRSHRADGSFAPYPASGTSTPQPQSGRSASVGSAYYTEEDFAESSKSELELEDGRRLSWEGHIRLDISNLAIGPFNQHKEHFVSSPTDLAPVTEFYEPGQMDSYY
jgi:hypothetical protein